MFVCCSSVSACLSVSVCLPVRLIVCLSVCFYVCVLSQKDTEHTLKIVGTVMILCFRTDMPGQTVQTQIRLLLDQGQHYLPFRLHRLDSLLYGRAT